MIFFIAFSVLHIGFIFWIWWHWERIKSEIFPASDRLTFSIIIPVRNEAGNIQKLIEELETQQYPKGSYEVLIVDDNSDDDTMAKAMEAATGCTMTVKVIALSEGLQGKKSAITRGVMESKNEIILTTDGDCSVGANWVEAYASLYEGENPVMITGPVRMTGRELFQRLQVYEFSALTSIGAASLHSGNAGMCNGANLSYRKEAFQEIKGYEGNIDIPSGDDEFLLQKIANKYPGRALFLKDERAVVSTPAKASLKELVNQRIRWTSKWKYHKSIFIRMSAVFVFFDYFAVILGLAEVTVTSSGILFFVAVFLVRWFVLYLFVRSVANFLGLKKLFISSLLAEIIYPFFVIFLGLASIFGRYSWKGRQYNDR